MEIERKFLVYKNKLPKDLTKYKCRHIEQGYLCTDPVIRIRKDNDTYVLTYKTKGLMSREEYEMPLTKESFQHLSKKIDGNLIVKDRYEIPFENSLIIELDVFKDFLEPLILAEVEFRSENDANSFVPPKWFSKDVTFSGQYHNSYLSTLKQINC